MDRRTRSYTILAISALLLTQCLFNLYTGIGHLSFLLDICQAQNIEELRAIHRLAGKGIEPGREIAVPMSGGMLNKKFGGSNGLVRFRISRLGQVDFPIMGQYPLRADTIWRDVFFIIVAVSLVFFHRKIGRNALAMRWIGGAVIMLNVAYGFFSLNNVWDLVDKFR